jgi:protoporphyrinogen oxidase
MRIGIIGAGFTGLSAAYQLVKDHDVTIFEKEALPGGLALGYKEKNWQWSLEQHYHHWFTNDAHILHLAKQIQHKVLIKRPKTSVFVENECFPLDSLSSVLSFPKLSPLERIRMGGTLGILKINPFWRLLEKYYADKSLRTLMGQKPYELLWEPLFHNKFGQYKNDISLAWFWARIYKRTAKLAYPEGGFLTFANSLASNILRKGGTITYNATTTQLIEKDTKVILQVKEQDGLKKYIFDRIIVTLPSQFFLQIAPQLDSNYKTKLQKLKGLGAINLVLRLSKPFLTNNTYWLSICDKKAPIMAIVEHTNFMNSIHYDNEHIVYIGNYLSPDHRYFSYSVTELLKEYDAYLEQHNRSYKKSLLGARIFKAPFAQPVIPINYSSSIPPFRTPLANVFLANMQQVYPWDRGTNYAVELGEKIARQIADS